MSLFNELKRRNVFRIGIAYAITARLIAQIAGLAAESFFAPDWVMEMIITMLVLGSPVALVMAWAYLFKGDPERALVETNKNPPLFSNSYQKAAIHFTPGNEWLRGIESDPRYPVLLEKIGLLEAWESDAEIQ